VSGDSATSKLFWSGGSQAVRLPKAMRLEGHEVRIRRRGRVLIVEPLDAAEEWHDFWDQLLPLSSPVRRRKTRRVARRAPF